MGVSVRRNGMKLEPAKGMDVFVIRNIAEPFWQDFTCSNTVVLIVASAAATGGESESGQRRGLTLSIVIPQVTAMCVHAR